MKNDTLHHYIGTKISPEQFIEVHTFAYVIHGILNTYDGSQQVSLISGECFIARKNRLARYNKLKEDNELKKVFVFFDEDFLRRFQEKHSYTALPFKPAETFIKHERNELLPNFIHSLLPYYDHGTIKEPFTDVKREELLLLLLQKQPELAGLLFDYGIPQKINLEEFMNKNFKFNVSTRHFALLTGRSLSAFKRDFQTLFNDTPGHWLIQKRLREAHFLLEKEQRKPSEIYLDLGFETLAHFSFSFKKQYGIKPTELIRKKD